MLSTYFADRGALHKAMLGKSLADCPFFPCSNFRKIRCDKFVQGGKGVFAFGVGAIPARVESLTRNISRRASEDQTG